MASRFAGTTIDDFGEHADAVREILAIEAMQGSRNGKLGEKTIDELLVRLAFWRHTFAPDAFAHGLQVGINSGKGVAYGGGAMRRYDPETEGPAARGGGGARRDPYAGMSRADRAAQDFVDNLPTPTDLLASGEIEPWEVPLWQLRPDHPKVLAWRAAHPGELISAAG